MVRREDGSVIVMMRTLDLRKSECVEYKPDVSFVCLLALASFRTENYRVANSLKHTTTDALPHGCPLLHGRRSLVST